jgi:methylglyoxal synthase
MEKMKKRVLPKIKTIAMVAHDSRKDDLIKWAKKHMRILTGFNIIATGTTGKLLKDALKKDVTQLLSGPYGGDQQLGSAIAEGKVHMVVFFWDPLEQQAHDNDVKALQRLAVLWNIPLACNRASADFMLTSAYLHTNYEIEVPETA